MHSILPSLCYMILFCVCTISKFQFCNLGFNLGLYALSRDLLMSVLILSNRMLPQYMPTYSSELDFKNATKGISQTTEFASHLVLSLYSRTSVCETRHPFSCNPLHLSVPLHDARCIACLSTFICLRLALTSISAHCGRSTHRTIRLS